MKPLYFTLTNKRPLMIIPDTMAHLDGHTVITHTYSIFFDIGAGNPLIARSKESTLHLEHIKDHEYFGYITFEAADKMFSYTADGQQELSLDEVAELIGHLRNVRDNPALWKEADH